MDVSVDVPFDQRVNDWLSRLAKTLNLSTALLKSLLAFITVAGLVFAALKIKRRRNRPADETATA